MASRLLVPLLVTVALLAGCQGMPPAGIPDPTDAPAPVATATAPAETTAAPPMRPLAGIGTGASQHRDPSFWPAAGVVADLAVWTGPIQDLENQRGSAAAAAQGAHDAGMAFALVTAPFRQEEAGFSVPFDAQGQRRWRDAVVTFLNDHRVDFLGIGTEVDYWRDLCSQHDRLDAYSTFVAWFDALAALLDETHPDVLVFPTFQYERMQGLRGGLWGGTTGAPSWRVLDDFPARDLTAFTAYPGLVYEKPDLVPMSHWDALVQHAPSAIIETGWHVDPDRDTFASNASAQAAYVRKLWAGVPETLPFVAWTFLDDEPLAPDPFSRMGLRDDTGQPRPAHQAWIDAAAS